MGARKLAPLMSSNKQDWGTPRGFYRWLSNAMGGFTLDVCASPHNAKCRRYFSKEDDGLAQSWQGERWFDNPEYDAVEPWTWKGADEALQGAPGAHLVASRVDTAWWRGATESERFGRLLSSRYVQATRTWWLRYASLRVGIYNHDERLVFEGGPQDGAPFPSSVLLYLPNGFRPRPDPTYTLDGRPPLTLQAPP